MDFVFCTFAHEKYLHWILIHFDFAQLTINFFQRKFNCTFGSIFRFQKIVVHMNCNEQIDKKKFM